MPSIAIAAPGGSPLGAFRSEDDRNAFAAELRFVHLLSDDDRVWIRGLGVDLSEEETLALLTCRHHEWVDNRSLSGMTGLHPADVTSLLRGLRTRELLLKVGDKRGARYRLGPAIEETVAGVKNPEVPEQNIQDNGANPEEPGENIQDNGANPEEPGENIQDNGANPEEPVENWNQLMAIAEPLRESARTGVSLRDGIVVELCGVQALSSQEIATLIGRDRVHVNDILRKLLKEGALVHLYPETPRSPRQRYLAIPVEKP